MISVTPPHPPRTHTWAVGGCGESRGLGLAAVHPNRTAFVSYYYKVKSGGGVAFSAVNSFRSGYSSSDGPVGSPTKVAIFGDMGVYSWNNMVRETAPAHVGVGGSETGGQERERERERERGRERGREGGRVSARVGCANFPQ